MLLRRVLFWSGACALALASASCGNGRTAILGYVYDVSTGKPLTDFKMEVDSPEIGTQHTSGDSGGMFQFQIKSDSDYIVRITSDGYRAFTTTNLRSVDGNVASDDLVHRRVYFAAMVPNAITHPAITGNVVDFGDGTPVDGGFFRAVPTGAPAGFQTQVFSNGNDANGNAVPRFWMPDNAAVAGPIVKGQFTIPAGSLLPGYNYTIAIVGAPGYQDTTSAFAPVTTATGFNFASQVNIRLKKQVNPGTPVLIGQNTLSPDGATPAPLNADRKIIWTFDRPISVDLTNLKGIGSNTLLSAAGTHANGTGFAITMATETPGANNLSANVAVTSSGNQVIVTLAPDSTLVTTSLASDDDYKYTIQGALTGNILIRDAAWNGPWSAFPAVNTTVIIKHNHLP